VEAQAAQYPVHAPLGFDKPLCAGLDGFTLHAATRAGALDIVGRERCDDTYYREHQYRGPRGSP
jgi:hypothetical protein